MWEKVKDAANNLSQKVKDATLKVLEEYKPKVLAALDNVKKVIIDGVKQVVIKVSNGIIEIMTDGESATSNGQAFSAVEENIYVLLDSSVPEINVFTDGKLHG